MNDTVNLIAKILVVVGGINWLLAVFGINLVTLIFRIPVLVNIVYVLIGLSALLMAKDLKQ